MSLLKIDSLNRKTGDLYTAGDFQIDLWNPIQGSYELQAAFIPADYPVIETDYNDRIPFFENATTKSATLTPGYYNSSTILTAIASALTTASGGYNTYTCTFNSVSQCITITASVGAFILKFGTTTTYSAASLFGFTATDSSSALTQTGSSPLVLNSRLSFNIQIEGSGEIVNTLGLTTTFYIPMNADLDRREFIEFHPNYPQRVHFKESKSRLHIRVLDDTGRVLNLQQNWQLLLKRIC